MIDCEVLMKCAKFCGKESFAFVVKNIGWQRRQNFKKGIDGLNFSLYNRTKERWNMEFVAIFSEMSWVVAVLLFVGLVFIFVEVLLPGFGFFGITGAASIVAGIVVRIVQGLNLLQSIVLILMILGFFVICLMVMVFSAQYGMLGRSGIFETSTTFSSRNKRELKELKKLVGKTGRASGVLNLGGKVKIRGELYDAMSIKSFIENNAHIKVVGVKDHMLLVRKWFE